MRGWAYAIGFGILGLAAHAESTTSANNDPLAAAKRDYAAVKSAEAESKTRVPRVVQESVPPLLQTENPPLLSPIQRARKVEQTDTLKPRARSADWLLDTWADLEGNSSGIGATGTPSETHHRRELFRFGGRLGGKSEKNEEAAERQRPPRSPSSTVRSLDFPPDAKAPNPLAPYLSGWMSPKDFELLQTSALTSPAGSEGAIVSRESRGGAAPRSTPQQSSGVHSPLVGPATDKIRDNPYLQVPSATLPPQQPPLASTFSQGGNGTRPAYVEPSVGTMTPPAPSVKTPTPTERWKRPDDTPHFKQLKRF